jgi:hypothetical protein
VGDHIVLINFDKHLNCSSTITTGEGIFRRRAKRALPLPAFWRQRPSNGGHPACHLGHNEKPGQPHLILILQHSAISAMVAELSRRMKGGLINTNGLCGK